MLGLKRNRDSDLAALAVLVGAFVVGLVLVLLVLTPTAASAQMSPICGERQTVVENLRELANEKPEAVGLTTTGMVLEIFTSEKGTWTLVVTDPTGKSCLLAVGSNWQTVTEKPDGV